MRELHFEPEGRGAKVWLAQGIGIETIYTRPTVRCHTRMSAPRSLIRPPPKRDDIVSPDCSTLDPKLDAFELRPPECALREVTAA